MTTTWTEVEESGGVGTDPARRHERTTDPTRRPERIIAQGVSKEPPITNDTCDTPVSNSTRICSREEEKFKKRHSPGDTQIPPVQAHDLLDLHTG